MNGCSQASASQCCCERAAFLRLKNCRILDRHRCRCSCRMDSRRQSAALAELWRRKTETKFAGAVAAFAACSVEFDESF